MPMLIFCKSEGSADIIRDGEEDRLRPSLGIIGNSHEKGFKIMLNYVRRKGEKQEKDIQII
jgi:hypothetical protein